MLSWLFLVQFFSSSEGVAVVELVLKFFFLLITIVSVVLVVLVVLVVVTDVRVMSTVIIILNMS